MSKTTSAQGPPKARLAFRVGVIGHRPNRLPPPDALDPLRHRIGDVLSTVRDTVLAYARTQDASLYAADAPLLRAISPLAEGADRLFAEAALDLGYALCCPMPFLQSDYEKDFKAPAALEAGSLERFRALLDQARDRGGLTTFELDGDRAEPARAYGAAGRIVLNQSDLLVAVWDGGEAAGRGGTLDTLRQAVRFHVPVFWLDAVAPHCLRILRTPADLRVLPFAGRGRGDGGDCEPLDQRSEICDAVTRVVHAELVLPGRSAQAQSESRGCAVAYYGERRPRVHVGAIWKPFRDLVGDGRLTRPSLLTGDFVEQISTAWPTGADGADEPPPEWVNRRLRAHYASSDKLADLYADRYRGGFVVTSLLAAVAVLAALLPVALEWPEGSRAAILSVVAEGLILCAMVGLISRGHARRWQARWMEYRTLAELIRQLRMLVPIGGARPYPRAPAHLASYGDPVQTWMYWHVRALAREVGLPHARVTKTYLGCCLDDLGDIASGPRNGQFRYHEVTCERAERIHRRLHLAALTLFAMTLAGIAIHVLPALTDDFPPTVRLERALAPGLLLSSAFFPALGAALAAINNQGEFQRIAKRSRAMAGAFEVFARRIRRLRERLGAAEGVSLREITEVASHMAQTMVDETMDWRAIVRDRAQAGG